MVLYQPLWEHLDHLRFHRRQSCGRYPQGPSSSAAPGSWCNDPKDQPDKLCSYAFFKIEIMRL